VWQIWTLQAGTGFFQPKQALLHISAFHTGNGKCTVDVQGESDLNLSFPE
jgi:hypothetical protein